MPTAAGADVVIRDLSARDRRAIVRLDALHTGEAKPAYWARLFRDLFHPADGHARVGLVARIDGELAGFVMAAVRALEFGSEPCGWILEIGVDPRFARQHVASRLLAESCRRLRASGVSTIRTMVRRNDVPVLTFFRTNGFSGGPYVQLELAGDAGAPGEGR